MPLLRAILDSPPHLVIFALDRDYRYVAFNENHRQTMDAIWNQDIQIGTNMLEIIGREDDRNKAQANFDRALGGEAFTLTEAYGEDGQRRFYRNAYSPIHENDEIIGLTVFLTDVTSHRETELKLQRHQADLENLARRRTAEMLHAQKLESLGMLAGGIAHDFNNILTAILSSAELAEMRTDRDGMVQELQRIQRATLRASELTHQMLAYAGKAESHKESVYLVDLVAEVVDLLGATVCRGRELVMQVEEDTPWVEADIAQLRQVVLNLLTNAAEADSNIIRVTLRRAHRAGQPMAHLSVADDGSGMTHETLARIYDPFFTTKFQGRGLGLAAVRGIVSNHDAQLEVQSTLGEGSRFDLWIPARPDSPTRDRASPTTRSTDALDAHILIVDDDPLVRGVCADILARSGATVTLASDGREALTALTDTSIDAVLLDLTMPGPSARATLTAMRALRPSLPVVLFSGYSESDARTEVGAIPTSFLAKPFTSESLISTLHGVLDAELYQGSKRSPT